MGKHKVCTEINSSTYKILQIYMEKRNYKMSEILRYAINEFLEKHAKTLMTQDLRDSMVQKRTVDSVKSKQ